MSAYPLRIPEHVMEEARQAAKEDKMSVNQMFASFIADGIGHRRAMKALQERAGRGDPKAALSILDRVADVEPDPGDEFESEDSPAAPRI